MKTYIQKPNQRKRSISNAHVGRKFESKVYDFFSKKIKSLSYGIEIELGLHRKKGHRFDLGCVAKKIIIECKSHKWTEGKNIPSAKLTVWNEAMYFFNLTPTKYRKIFVVLRDLRENSEETLGEYYIRTHGHLIPKKVEIWEFNEKARKCYRLKKA